jgi:hypothetical protein
VVCTFPAGVIALEIVQFLRKNAHCMERIRSVQSRGSRCTSKSRISTP